MSTRERWIVYPLLFLTLGIALRDKVNPPRQIRCEQLQVEKMICGEAEIEQTGRIRQMLCNEAEVAQTARIRQVLCDRVESGQSVCRSLLVNGSNGRPVVAAGMDPRSHNGLVEVLAGGQSTEGGGMVTAVDHTGKAVIMGYLGKDFGVFAHLPGTGAGLTVPLTQLWRFEPKGGTLILPKKGLPPATVPKKQLLDPKKQPPDKVEVPPVEGGK